MYAIMCVICFMIDVVDFTSICECMGCDDDIYAFRRLLFRLPSDASGGDA